MHTGCFDFVTCPHHSSTGPDLCGAGTTTAVAPLDPGGACRSWQWVGVLTTEWWQVSDDPALVSGWTAVTEHTISQQVSVGKGVGMGS